MNTIQIGGIIRAALATAFGYLAAKGLFPSGWIDGAIGLGGAIGVAVWSYYSNRIATMVEEIAKSSEVKAVVVDEDLANAIPSAKVVPNDPTRDIL